MKKITLFAFVAALILLAGCNKENKQDPQPEAKNPIVSAFDYCKVFYLADSTQVVTQLINDGWTKTSPIKEYTAFSKINYTDSTTDVIGIDSEDGVVIHIYEMLGDMSGKNGYTDGETFKGLMEYMGESYSFGTITWPFAAMATSDGYVHDYATALSSIVDACKNGNVVLGWGDASSHVMFSKTYSSQNKMDFVTIEIE